MSTSSHCRNALEINDSLFISGLLDNIYENKFSHFGQNGIFRSDNVTLVSPDGNSIIKVYTTSQEHLVSFTTSVGKS